MKINLTTAVMQALVAITLLGCANNLDYAKQEVACVKQGGVYDYGEPNDYSGKVTCRDGTEIEYSDWKILTGSDVAAELDKLQGVSTHINQSANSADSNRSDEPKR